MLSVLVDGCRSYKLCDNCSLTKREQKKQCKLNISLIAILVLFRWTNQTQYLTKKTF